MRETQLYKTGENIDEFPEPSDPRMNLKSPSKWQVRCADSHARRGLRRHADVPTRPRAGAGACAEERKKMVARSRRPPQTPTWTPSSATCS